MYAIVVLSVARLCSSEFFLERMTKEPTASAPSMMHFEAGRSASEKVLGKGWMIRVVPSTHPSYLVFFLFFSRLRTSFASQARWCFTLDSLTLSPSARVLICFRILSPKKNKNDGLAHGIAAPLGARHGKVGPAPLPQGPLHEDSKESGVAQSAGPARPRSAGVPRTAA